MSENGSKYLKFSMDARWKGYIPEYNQERFVEITESLINPSADVPEIIRNKLERVKSIYILRSVDYELQDVAEFLMYTVLELALRHKFEAINNKKTRKGLGSLLHWAKDQLYLSINEDRIKFICSLRNKFAHLKSPQDLHGTTSSFLIKEMNDLINELYSR